MSIHGTRRFVCFFCGNVYDEALGWPDEGIAAGTLWEDLPDDWDCPGCTATKADYMQDED